MYGVYDNVPNGYTGHGMAFWTKRDLLWMNGKSPTDVDKNDRTPLYTTPFQLMDLSGWYWYDIGLVLDR
jgi:hypothetical protein